MRILILSGYDAESHQRWREGLAAHFTDIAFEVIALPPRWFAWRSGGGALSVATHYREELRQSFDLVVCTSVLNIASLRGLVPELSQTPIISYFHENQFAYPVRSGQRDARMLMQTIESALSADMLVFNSHYNRRTFIDGAAELLDKMPDLAPDVRPCFEHKSRVVPVAVSPRFFMGEQTREPRLVWNHRWEWDKAPERLFGALRVLKKRGVQPRVAFVGQSFREIPVEITQGLREFSDQIDVQGYLDAQRYRSLLSKSSHVVSTALHEFQGLAVLEAVAAGCVPIVPDRLSYQEQFPSQYRYASVAMQDEACALADQIEREWAAPSHAPDVRAWSWENVGPMYLEAFEAATQAGRRID
ncbi:MAG: DUF3524 domain-containing protein [bacterium]